MVVVPLSKVTEVSRDATSASEANSANWIRIAAASTLAASGALLITGNRRAGLVTAAVGATLAMLDQKETVSLWWDALPGVLEQIDDLLGRAQNAVEDFSAQGQRLRRALGK